MLRGQKNPGRIRINQNEPNHPVYCPFFFYSSLSFQIHCINLSLFHHEKKKKKQSLRVVFWPLNLIWVSIEYKQVKGNLAESQRLNIIPERRDKGNQTQSDIPLCDWEKEWEKQRVGEGERDMEKRHSVWLKCRYAEEFAHLFFESCEVRVSVKFWGFITLCRHLNLV